MAYSGPRNGSTAATSNAVGTEDWGSPSGVLAYGWTAALAVLAASEISYYIKVTDFGFTLPSDAVIQGIVVDVNKYASASSSITDNIVKLVKGGSVVGNNNAGVNNWPTSLTYQQYGTNYDLWGETWAYSDINASNFGVVISAKNDAGAERTAYIDHIRITVYYTVPQTVSPSSISGAEAFGSHIVSLGTTLSIYPSSIASAEAFGTASVKPLLLPSGILSEEIVPSPRIVLYLKPTGIVSGEAFSNDTSKGPENGSSAEVSIGVGTRSWSNATNIYTADATYASVSLPTGTVSNYLRLFGFNFALPTTAVIKGVQISFKCYANLDSAIEDYSVKLFVDGAESGTAPVFTGTATWDTTSGYRTYGNSTSMWGLSITPTQVNSLTQFGCSISVRNTASATVTAYVDHLCMYVYYEEGFATVSPGPVDLWPSSIASAEAIGSHYVNRVQEIIRPIGIYGMGSAHFGTPYVLHLAPPKPDPDYLLGETDCPICGFTFKSKELVKQYDGREVCKYCKDEPPRRWKI